MKYFVFGDVHGDYKAMMSALTEAGYDRNNAEHQIISLGDNFGRASTGDKSKGVWRYLALDKHCNKPICIRGNHESILLDTLNRGHLNYIDILNGEDKTIASFAHTSPSQARLDSLYVLDAAHTGVGDWIKSLPWYFETDHYVFTHGWLPSKDYKNASQIEWDEASWSETPYAYAKYKYDRLTNKTLVVGHWHTIDFWKDKGEYKYDIFKDPVNKVIFMDGCTALNHKLNLLVIDD